MRLKGHCCHSSASETTVVREGLYAEAVITFPGLGTIASKTTDLAGQFIRKLPLLAGLTGKMKRPVEVRQLQGSRRKAHGELPHRGARRSRSSDEGRSGD